jgi:hypothetical protein
MAAVAKRFNLAPDSFILKTSTTVLDQEKLTFLLKEVDKNQEKETAKGGKGTLALYLNVLLKQL